MAPPSPEELPVNRQSVTAGVHRLKFSAPPVLPEVLRSNVQRDTAAVLERPTSCTAPPKASAVFWVNVQPLSSSAASRPRTSTAPPEYPEVLRVKVQPANDRRLRLLVS